MPDAAPVTTATLSASFIANPSRVLQIGYIDFPITFYIISFATTVINVTKWMRLAKLQDYAVCCRFLMLPFMMRFFTGFL